MKLKFIFYFGKCRLPPTFGSVIWITSICDADRLIAYNTSPRTYLEVSMSHDKVLQVLRMKQSIPWELDPGVSALLVIDMQRYFVHPKHSFGDVLERMVPGVTAGYFKRMAETVVPNIQRLLALCRCRSIPVYFTGTGTERSDRSDLPGWLRGFDTAGQVLLGRVVWPHRQDESWQIDESVAPQRGEIVVNKRSASALTTTDLDQEFRARGIRTLLVVGTSTDVCVTTTARDAADRGYDVVVVEDACTTLSTEMHTESLNAIRLAFGHVLRTDEILSSWAEGVKAAVQPT